MSEKKLNPNAATPAERLKYARTLARLTRAYLEMKYGLPVATLKAWENNSTRLTSKGLKRCIDIYRQEGIVLSQEWVLTGEGLPPKLSLNIGQYFAKDLDELAPYSADDNACILREAKFFKESYSDAVILILSSDEMEPFYQAGDYVGGRFRHGTDIATALRHDCIIRLEDNSDIFRRLFKSTTGPDYNLACINPATNAKDPILFNTKIIAAAPVIWHRRPNV